MFSVYAVKIHPANQKKERYHIHTYESEKEARIIANHYAFEYTYTYVKEVGSGTTVHYIRHHANDESDLKEDEEKDASKYELDLRTLPFLGRRRFQLNRENYYARSAVAHLGGEPVSDEVKYMIYKRPMVTSFHVDMLEGIDEPTKKYVIEILQNMSSDDPPQ